MDSSSAIPKWLQQILPKWFCDRPDFTEAAYAFLKSQYHATYPIIGLMGYFAWEAGNHDLWSMAVWIWNNWQGVFIGYTLGVGPAASRAQQAAAKAAKGP